MKKKTIYLLTSNEEVGYYNSIEHIASVLQTSKENVRIALETGTEVKGYCVDIALDNVELN